MFYIFNKEKTCVGSTAFTPNEDDLRSRGEYVLSSPVAFINPIDKDGVVQEFVYTPTEEEVKQRALAKAYADFVAKRDGITWVVHDTGERYGYDRQAEDITNFLAAKEVAAVAGSVTYKVHLSETEKGLKEHTVDMLNKALLQSSKEQIAAYKEFELKRAEIKSGGV